MNLCDIFLLVRSIQQHELLLKEFLSGNHSLAIPYLTNFLTFINEQKEYFYHFLKGLTQLRLSFSMLNSIG